MFQVVKLYLMFRQLATITYKHYLFALVLGSLLIACSKETIEEPIDTPSSTDSEIKDAKAFYNSNGLQFKFRLYHNEGDLLNPHEASIKKLFERNGKLSFIADLSSPWVSPAVSCYAIDCEGEVVKTRNIGNPFLSAFNENELTADNKLISYNYTEMAHGGYGGSGAVYHKHTDQQWQYALSPSSVGGYMQSINNKLFIISLNFNGNGGQPSLYTYIFLNQSWVSDPLPMVNASGIWATNDVSKVGHTNKAFIAWLSYDSDPASGKLNLMSFDGDSFSPVWTKEIGLIGEGHSMEKKNTVLLHRNPNNIEQPYIVVRQFNSNLMDVYRFTGNGFDEVYTNIELPEGLPASGAGNRSYRYLAFSGTTAYVIAGINNNLYKLKNQTFTSLPLGLSNDDFVSAIETDAQGVYIAIDKFLKVGGVNRTVADVVYSAN